MSARAGGATEPRVKRRRVPAGVRGLIGYARTRALGVSPIDEARGPAARGRRAAIYRRRLLMADAMAAACASTLTTQITARPLLLTYAGIAGLPMLLLGAKLHGLYDRDQTLLAKTTLEEAPKLFQVATLCALVAWLGSGLITAPLEARTALLLWLSLAVLLPLARAGARALALELLPSERCLFIGDESLAGTVGAKLAGHPGMKAEMVARVDPGQVALWSTDACSPTRIAEVRGLAQALDVQRAIIASPDADADSDTLLDLVRTLKEAGMGVSVLPRLLEVVGSSVEFDSLRGMTVIGVRRIDLTRSSAAVKRAFDLCGATICLLALAPLLLAIALAIKLDSDGPVFFRQLRVGKHGERFYMFKFRTMVPDAEAMKDSLRELNEAQDGLFKIARDPRITRVGGFLRKSALDELPQLLNVLRREMSLVGPRPLVLEEDARIEGWHRRRLELLPGMTGHWQLLGPARVPLREMVAIDYLYVANWSLWADVKILLRTVPHVFARRGL
jgi:exopolysaccharide biosynthesis polyprenyl glycosylphosphotransferase